MTEIKVLERKVIRGPQGGVFRMLRADDPEFSQFGEIYFSLVEKGVVRGWYWHERSTLNYMLLKGELSLAFAHEASDLSMPARWHRLHLKALDGKLVQIPPRTWYAFAAGGPDSALLANCATELHDEAEMKRAPMESHLAESMLQMA